MSPHLPVTIPADRTRRFRLLSIGAGVQSTAVYLLALRGEIPPIDGAVFADTGEEPKLVYRRPHRCQNFGPRSTWLLVRVQRHVRKLIH